MTISRYDLRLDEDRLPRLIRDCTVTYADNVRLGDPGMVAHWLDETLDMSSRAREIIAVTMHDSSLRMIGYSIVSEGTICAAYTTPREIYQMALAAGAVSICVAHQHPSGDPTPSEDDLSFLKRIKKAGDLIGVTLLDFLIIGTNGRYYSAQEDRKL